MDDIRFIAGPIIQRWAEKVETERMAALKAHEEANARKRAEQEARKKASTPAAADAEMKDADAASNGEKNGDGDESMPELDEAS